MLVCSWDGHNEDQLVGSATIPLSAAYGASSSDSAAPQQYALTDDAGRQRGVVVARSWRVAGAPVRRVASSPAGAAAPVPNSATVAIPSPRHTSPEDETRRRVAALCRMLRFHHSLCLGAAVRRWAMGAAEVSAQPGAYLRKPSPPHIV